MRKLLVTLLVLAILLVGADFLGRYLAERAISQGIAARVDTGGTTPQTDIGGWSFLVQVVSGRYEQVEVAVPTVNLTSLRNISAVIDLTNVRMPLSDVLSGTIDSMTADRAAARAVIPAVSLADALKRPVTLSSDPEGNVILGTDLDVNGQRVPVSVTADAAVVDNTLELRGKTIDSPSVPLTPEISATVNTDFSVDIPMVGLPFPLASADVSVESGNLVVLATATDVKAADLR